MVGAPSSTDPLVSGAHLDRSLALLRAHGCPGLAALNTNENGAETTLNGWFQSLSSGLPMVDLACNGRAHPTGLMGALGLHRHPDHRSLQAFAGGPEERYVEGVVTGPLGSAAAIVTRAAVEAGGIIAAARNPVDIGFAARQGAPGAISRAIAIGRVFLDKGVAGLEAGMGLAWIAEGGIAEYVCGQREGLDVGHVVLDDRHRTRVDFVNEYLLVTAGGRRSCFPHLIMLFGEDGEPLPSARLAQGRTVRVGLVRRERLILSRTMSMVELYDPIRDLLGLPPRAGDGWADDADPLG
ncbi:hypothetical protein ACFSTI_11770 [Rhizorhabdus histidinilytica]